MDNLTVRWETKYEQVENNPLLYTYVHDCISLKVINWVEIKCKWTLLLVENWALGLESRELIILNWLLNNEIPPGIMYIITSSNDPGETEGAQLTALHPI